MKEAKDLETMSRVIFGDPTTGEMGMKDKVDKMYDILVKVDNIQGFFKGLGSFMKWLVLLGTLLALFKGWLVGVFTYILNK